jgi:hypothetical protein
LQECGEYGVPTAGQRCCLGGGAKHSIMLIKLINEEVVQAEYHGIRVPTGITTGLCLDAV